MYSSIFSEGQFRNEEFLFAVVDRLFAQAAACARRNLKKYGEWRKTTNRGKGGERERGSVVIVV
jgi:hypothetical protein